MNFIAEHVVKKLSVRPTASELGTFLGFSVAPAIHSVKAHEISENAVKPWRLG